MGMAAAGNNSGPQFNLPPQQLPQGTQQQQINMQQQIHLQMPMNQQRRVSIINELNLNDIFFSIYILIYLFNS